MVYTRGSKEDYDRFSRVSGDQGWSWNRLIPYMRKVCLFKSDVHVLRAKKNAFQNERFSPPADRTTTERFNPAVHGFDGVNTVSLPGFARGSDTVVIKAASESKEFPFNIDMNSGNPLGIGNYNLCGALGTSTQFFFSRVDPVNYQKRLKKQLRYILPGATIHESSKFAHHVEYDGHPCCPKWL